MKCPACSDLLTQFDVGSVTVDVCQGGCGGIWFDAFELQRVDEKHETARGGWLVHIEHDPVVVVDQTKKRGCPRCPEVKLMRHFLSQKRLVEVDQCPNCDGYWLDCGELARVREEKELAAQTKSHGRPGISPEVIRYLYRLKASDAAPEPRVSLQPPLDTTLG